MSTVTTKECVVGIDLGTSVVKVGIYTLDGTRIALTSGPLTLQHQSAGRVEQDLNEFYEVASTLCRRCITENGINRDAVKAIAISAQMAGVGIVDFDHVPLAPFDSWLDNRCGEIVDDLAPIAADVVASAGCAPTISIGPKMLWWQRYEPDICNRASSFVTAAGFVAESACGRLGNETIIDPTHLHFAAVADVAATIWNDDLINQFGLDRDLLPEIVESTQFIGNMTAAAAVDFGLPPSIPVAAGCGDTAASALGVGALAPGTALDIAGTAGVFMSGTENFVADMQHRTIMTMRAALPGHWYALAYVSGAGQVVEWVCHEILGQHVVDDTAYAALEDAVRSIPPGSDGLLMSPHFDGRVAPATPQMRGALIGLDYSHTRSHIARAALESIAFEYLSYLNLVNEQQPDKPVRRVFGAGGGAQSAAWNQIKADVLGVDYLPIGDIDPGTRGAAIVAIVALGHSPPNLPIEAFGTTAQSNPDTSEAYALLHREHQRWNSTLAANYASPARTGGIAR